MKESRVVGYSVYRGSVEEKRVMGGSIRRSVEEMAVGGWSIRRRLVGYSVEQE